MAADFPVTFAGTVGLYRPADEAARPADTAVLFVSSWGFEELCARKFWRMLAGDLGRQGIASLRFDYPGTGDALDLEDYSAGLDIWHRSIVSAASVLRDLSGAKRLLLVGHSIGAALAWRAAEALGDVAGIAMAAPATSGRRWVREFMALSRMADHGAIKHATPPSGPAMGEQRIPDAILAGIRALDISRPVKAPAPDVLVLSQEGRAGDAAFLEHLSSLGVRTRTMPFEGYDRFIRDVLLSVPPRAAIGELVAWACGLKGEDTAAPRTAFPENRPLAGDGFNEMPVRFGVGNRLYGILCEPQGPRRGATVIMLSTGYDRMSGWGRITTRICRDLARAGIPAFRFDFANVADSPPHPEAPDQVMYDESLVRDVGEAMAFLEERRLSAVVLSGRCSGAYTAFRSGVRYEAVKAVVPVNPFDFSLPPDTDVDALIGASLQPLASYGEKMRSGGFWKRVLRGEVNVGRGVRNLSRMLVSKGVATALPVLVRFPFLSRSLRAVTRDFEAMAANGTRVSLIYSEGDIGVPNLEAHFGKRGYLMRRYDNTNLVFIAEADHNLTTAPAREYWQAELQETALRLAP
ncbi:alpha/beta fold hydrolase [Shinella sp. BYT-45]|uniref:alpha/beta fold hydrolase n=1 Tax=Shinella sp. BYT-45 TaxID=3377377 RepID=UPI00397FC16B